VRGVRSSASPETAENQDILRFTNKLLDLRVEQCRKRRVDLPVPAQFMRPGIFQGGPRLTPEFLAEERENMGKWWFMQEYMTRFMDAQGAAFTEAEVQAAFSKDVETWDLGRAVSTKRGTWDAPDNKWDL
jgi:hypothetical protein